MNLWYALLEAETAKAVSCARWPCCSKTPHSPFLSSLAASFSPLAPHLDMVAGLAYCRSATSNSSFTCGCRRMRSPFGSVSSLLSSITLFMFSTHTASTSPSNTM
jgi:hypothetical protein